jgi:hypothetical protein
MHVLTRIAFCVLLVAGGGAAGEIAPSGAQALTAQLRAWFGGMLGPDAPELPVQAEVEGDHYRVIIPLPGIRTQVAEPAVSAAARKLPDGRWGIDDARFPGKFSFAIRPMPPDARPGTETVVIGDQQTKATIDPELKLPSSFGTDGANIVITTTGPSQTQEQHIDRYTATGNATPAPSGLLDVSTTTEVEGWRTGALAVGGVAAGSGVRSATATAHIQGLNPSQVGPAIAALVSLRAALPAPMHAQSGTGNHVWLRDLPPPGLAALHRLVAALPGIATAFRIDETLEGVQFEIAGIGGAAVDRVRLGIGGEAPAGLLRAWFDLGLKGLSIRGLPEAQAALVPRMVSFRPSVSGVPVEALNRLLAAMTVPGHPPVARLDPEVAALFAQGSLTVGIEALDVAIGPAELTGAGSVLLLSPTEREGQARITATGFDALVEQIRGDPRSGAALPLLILARGLAKADGDRLVWTIAIDRSGKTTVNGIGFPGFAGGPGRGG